MFVLIIAVGFGLGCVGAMVAYLLEFGRASRRDSLFRPASTAGARRARRVTGMYTRGTDELSTAGPIHEE